MLQTGIGFIRLSVGHKKCAVFICTPVSRAAIGPSAQSWLYQQNATHLQPETWSIKTSYNHSIRTLAWFLSEAARFSELGKLTRSLFAFDYVEKFLGVYILIILCIWDVRIG